MADLREIFGGPFIPQRYVDPPQVQIANAMSAAGIDPPPSIQIDGQLHRFSTKGRKRDDSGWYLIFPDDPIAGRFGCWRDGIDAVFRADMGREYSAAENMAIVRRQSEAKAERDLARQRKAEVAASTVETIWRDAIGASPDHPYLKRKGIEAHGARLTGDGRLIVPLYDVDGGLSSLQYISEDEKRYHPGGSVKGCTWKVGEVTDGPIFISEGFATAATIHEVSQRPCVIAYSANNLPEATRQVREEYGPAQEIIIIADNDESGVGRNKADEASAKHGGRIIMPPDRGDANDYYLNGGDLAGLLFPPADDWLVPADSFSEQPDPIRWQIKRWLQSQALIMVHGPSGGGKTFLVLDMVMSVASNGAVSDWFGNKVRPGTVAYLAGEGHHGLRGRVAAWKQHKGVPALDMWLSRHGLDLNTPQGYQKTADALRALPNTPEIIVVDTLHRFLDGDENSSEVAKGMLDSCSALMAEFGATVILVHHTGVSDEAQHRARGSSAWKGALDIEVSVIPPRRDGDSIEIIQRKAKDSETSSPVFVDLKTVPITGWLDEDGDQVTSCVIALGVEPVKAKKDPLHKQKKIIEDAWYSSAAGRLGVNPYVTRESIQTLLEGREMSAGTIKQYLKPTPGVGLIGKLLEAKLIEPVQDGWMIIGDQWMTGFIS